MNISDFDQDYQHALAAAMMNSLNNNTRGGSSVEITGDAVEEAVRLAVMADRADSGIRVQYMISALVEQFGVGTEYIYSLVNSKLQRAANSAAIANIMNANLEYVKGSLFDRVTIGSMVNNENGVVIEIRKSTVPTVAPTTRTIKDIEKSNMDLTLIAAVGIGAIIALCCGGFLFYYCCIRSMGNKSKAIVSPDTEIAGARSS